MEQFASRAHPFLSDCSPISRSEPINERASDIFISEDGFDGWIRWRSLERAQLDIRSPQTNVSLSLSLSLSPSILLGGRAKLDSRLSRIGTSSYLLSGHEPASSVWLVPLLDYKSSEREIEKLTELETRNDTWSEPESMIYIFYLLFISQAEQCCYCCPVLQFRLRCRIFRHNQLLVCYSNIS